MSLFMWSRPFIVRKKNWCPLFHRAAWRVSQPFEQLRNGTEVGYCEVSLKVILQRLWRLKEFSGARDSRAAGACPGPQLSENQAWWCPPAEGICFLPEEPWWNRPWWCDSKLWLTGLLESLSHMGTFPSMDEYYKNSSSSNRNGWAEGLWTALVLPAFCQSSWQAGSLEPWRSYSLIHWPTTDTERVKWDTG